MFPVIRTVILYFLSLWSSPLCIPSAHAYSSERYSLSVGLNFFHIFHLKQVKRSHDNMASPEPNRCAVS